MVMEAASYRQLAHDLQTKLVAMRRHLHQHPELSSQEFETTKRIKEWLSEAGIRLLPLDVPTGVLAEIGAVDDGRTNGPTVRPAAGPTVGPTVVLRADIDALPVTEQTGLPFASQVPGVMHACGHDFHTAAIIGAGLILKQLESQLPGRVRLLFQPAEEAADGAQAVIAAGALEGADAIFGLHNKPDLPVGTVGVRAGALMASVDQFVIMVKGKGGHAAIPNSTIDPIVVASAIVTALQSIVSRQVSPLDSAVVSVCKFAAGSNWNVIPEQAELEGTVRTFDAETRARMPDLIRRLIEGVAAAHGAEATLHWISHQPAVHNDARMAELIGSVAAEQQLQVVEAEPTMGGEDFSLYQQLIPGCFVWIGTDGKEQWHHPEFTVNEEALAVSAALFAQTAVCTLQKLSE